MNGKNKEFNNSDRHAIVQLSLCCTKLEYLTFSACSFLDYGALHRLVSCQYQNINTLSIFNESNWSFYRELIEYYQAGGLETLEEIELELLLRDQEAFNTELEGLIQPFANLTNLKLSSPCSNSTLVFLLLHTPTLKNLFIGGRSSMSNETLLKVWIKSILKSSTCTGCSYIKIKSCQVILKAFHIFIPNFDPY